MAEAPGKKMETGYLFSYQQGTKRGDLSRSYPCLYRNKFD